MKSLFYATHLAGRNSAPRSGGCRSLPWCRTSSPPPAVLPETGMMDACSINEPGVTACTNCSQPQQQIIVFCHTTKWVAEAPTQKCSRADRTPTTVLVMAAVNVCKHPHCTIVFIVQNKKGCFHPLLGCSKRLVQ